MKQFLVLASLLLANTTQAQTWIYDTISMNPGYSQNVFYRMNNQGAVSTAPSNNWHIAFSLSISDSASIIANHGLGNAFVKVFDVHKSGADWATVGIADTGSSLLYNGEMGWYQGAFNNIPSADPFNFGWGQYNLSNHVIYGDSIFIVKASANYYKVIIDSFKALTGDWYFRTELLNTPSSTNSYAISKSAGYSNRLFAYFNLDNGTDLDREPTLANWDFEFITYPALVTQGTSTAIYGVTGVLTKRGVQTAEALGVEVDDAYNNWQPYVSSISASNFSLIGSDWKFFNGTAFQVLDSVSFFIQPKNDTIWQLQFLNFAGSSSGEIVFRKRILFDATETSNVPSNFSKLILYPNPAANTTQLLLNSNTSGDAQIEIVNLNGAHVKSLKNKIFNGANLISIPVENLSNGNYFVQIKMNGFVQSEKLIINK